MISALSGLQYLAGAVDDYLEPFYTHMKDIVKGCIELSFGLGGWSYNEYQFPHLFRIRC